MIRKYNVGWGHSHKAELKNQFDLFDEGNVDRGLNHCYNTKDKEDKLKLENIWYSFELDHIFRNGVTLKSFIRNYANTTDNRATQTRQGS